MIRETGPAMEKLKIRKDRTPAVSIRARGRAGDAQRDFGKGLYVDHDFPNSVTPVLDVTVAVLHVPVQLMQATLRAG